MNNPALFPAESNHIQVGNIGILWNIWNNWNVIRNNIIYRYILDVPKITVNGIFTSQWNVRRIICFFSKKFAVFYAGLHLEKYRCEEAVHDSNHAGVTMRSKYRRA